MSSASVAHTGATPAQDATRLERAMFEVKRIIVGQDQMVERIFVALLARGHCLLEGVPGVAKTLAVQTVATVIGGSFARIQFTPDLMPADLVGTRIYRQGSETFDVELGPVFVNFLLADEINRAPAKVQSALLEVMAERTVTVDGVGHAVPDPFVVIATQNPVDLDGTYRLPEAQLDRFLMRVTLGYPDPEHEIEVLRPGSGAGVVEKVREVTDPDRVAAVRSALRHIHVADPLLGYVRAIGAATRTEERLRLGASTRALRGLVAAAQAFAAAQGRHYVVPSDVQRLAEPVLAHRLIPTRDALLAGEDPARIVADVVESVEAPRPVPA